MKLQDAYVSESNAIGSWKLIGYVAPGAQTSGTAGTTTNFKYEMGSVAADASVLLTGTLGQVWKATNVPALNDCTANNCVWELHVKAGSTGDGVEYGTKVPTNGAPLTPTFAKIGTYDAQ